MSKTSLAIALIITSIGLSAEVQETVEHSTIAVPIEGKINIAHLTSQGHFQAGTSWNVGWQYEMQQSESGLCRISANHTKLNVTITLPQFNGASPKQQPALDAFVAQLKAHETEHYLLAQDTAYAIDAKIRQLPKQKSCETLSDLIKSNGHELLEQAKAQHSAYDAISKNGTLQTAYQSPLRPTAAERVATAIEAQASALKKNADKDGWVAMNLSGGHITIPVTLNGIDGFAMLDSGAELNGISQSFVDQNKDDLHFGDAIRLKSVFGTEEKRLINGVKVGLFGTELTLSDLTPAQLGRADLLLGSNFLRNFIIQIDYLNERLRLLPHSAVDLKKLANVPMRMDKGSTLPVVQISVALDEQLWLTLDTGNSGGLFVRRTLAEKYDWLEKHASSKHLVGGANGQGEVETFRIPYFKIGPYELENIAVTVPAEGQKSSIGRTSDGGFLRAGANSKGLLGFDILKHFVLTLDVKNMKLHLAPAELANTQS